MSWSVLILALFIVHLVHFFWISKVDPDYENMHDWYHLIYLLCLLPNFIALVLYAIYFSYWCNCCGKEVGADKP